MSEIAISWLWFCVTIYLVFFYITIPVTCWTISFLYRFLKFRLDPRPYSVKIKEIEDKKEEEEKIFKEYSKQIKIDPNFSTWEELNF